MLTLTVTASGGYCTVSSISAAIGLWIATLSASQRRTRPSSSAVGTSSSSAEE